jgi:hypothetical protein
MLRDLADLFGHLDATLVASVKSEIAALPEDRLLELHFGLNLLIRTLAFYQNKSEEGKAYFSQLGDPDEASEAAWHGYGARRHGRPEIMSNVWRPNTCHNALNARSARFGSR